MAKQLQIRGGTTAQHATFVGAGRELTVDTTKQTVVVHDGSTAGGFPLARESVVTALNNRLTLVDNTADSTKNVLSATKLITARTIAMTGDLSWSTSFDGSGNVTSAGTLANSGVTAGTYRSVTTDAKGRVTAGTNPTTIAGYGITDAYNKTEIDTFIQGFKPKTEVKLATTANITLNGAQTIDGISAIVGDRVLVKNQTTQSENGIYVVSATSWTRATDSDSALELTGSYCFVSQGSAQLDTGWYMNSDSVVLGTTAIVWIQFTGTGAYAPISHVGTNGTSHATVTQSVNGFMLSTDKLKLDSATNINTANTIVMRDSSGNFTAGLITGTSFNSITGLSSTTPLINGTAEIGTSTTTARADHVHPSDTTMVSKVTSTDNAIVRFDGVTGNVQNSNVIIDSAGNLGLGVTPSTLWDSNTKVIQIKNASFGSNVPSQATIRANIFYDGALSRYISNNYATAYQMLKGTHTWYTAPSGIAGATTTITSGKVYTVTVLGESTLAQWQAFFSALSVLPTVGQSITATATGTLAGGGTVTQAITFNTAMTLDVDGNSTILGSMTANAGRSIVTYGSNNVQFLGLNTDTIFGNTGAYTTKIYTNGVERLKIDSSGNLLLTSGTGALGYGTGAGGTVTQLTSKSTAVTLNNPTGQITMNNSALAAGASIKFTLNNSIIGVSDFVIPIGDTFSYNYRIEIESAVYGSCVCRVTNITASSLSEALVFRIAVIKGAIV